MKPVIKSGMSEKWIGRFAPTPSGPLHFGSLVAAVGSYLIAKQKGGQWLLRIEDIDPPREMPGAASQIIQTLEDFGFEWDGEITYQSQRTQVYQQALEILESKQLIYACDCSRKIIQQRSRGSYDGFCRDRQLTTEKEVAIRIKYQSKSGKFFKFNDHILGDCRFKSVEDTQDFVLWRRDGLAAYQLAVVADDIAQGVDHVVRGADILDSTPRQNFLYHCFEKQVPAYFHLPLVLDKGGDKLSKRHFAEAIKAKDATSWLVKSLLHLGQDVEPQLNQYSAKEIIQWALKNWRTENIGKNPQFYQS